MIRLLFRVFLLLLLIASVLALARNTIILHLSDLALRQTTGLSLDATFLNVNFVRSRIAARDVTIYNPKNAFHERVAIKLPSLEFDVDWVDLIRGKAHFSRVLAEIQQLNLIKNEEGKTNLDELRKDRRFQIDLFDLSLKTVSLIHEKSSSRAPLEIKVNAKNRVYRNVHDTSGVDKILTDLTRQALPENLPGLARRWLSNKVDDASDALKGVGDKIKSWIGETLHPSHSSHQRSP